MSEIQRGALPIADIESAGAPAYDAKSTDTSFAPIAPLRPPADAPNVVIVLLDDVGFGASSAFGGPVSMPTAERLAADGLKYTRFHTTALCSPTRAALLSGRNHHTVGMGGITETATSAPGYTSMRPNSCQPLAEILKLMGYATAHVGKCHEVPVWESSPAGPFERWPSPGNGFEYFYGFIGGETNQYYPALHEGTNPVEPDRGPEQGYHLMEDLADRGIAWVRRQKALTPDKPFLLYFAPGATHTPHHVPTEWADKYRGAFDDGWDALRERTFARQEELGVIAADSELTARHEEIPAWTDTEDSRRAVLARPMENYAGFLEFADHHVGRLIDSLAELEILDDTLVYYIIGDNGASAEGTVVGTFNAMTGPDGGSDLETVDFLRDHIDQIGSPQSYPHYAVGWAHALCTPYQRTKRSPRTGAGPATPRSCTTPRESNPQASYPISSPTSSTSPRRSSRWPACPRRPRSTASPRSRWRATAWTTASTMPPRPNVTRRSTSRCSATAGSTPRAFPRSPSTAPRGTSGIVLFTFDETTDVGRDTGAPVTADYPANNNAYEGEIRWIRIDLADDSHDHLIPPDEHFKIAMTRQ